MENNLGILLDRLRKDLRVTEKQLSDDIFYDLIVPKFHHKLSILKLSITRKVEQFTFSDEDDKDFGEIDLASNGIRSIYKFADGSEYQVIGR